MRIASIQLEGFKSFHSATTFTFPKAITAIVGPNGSGKSNIADAFRWVLGEQGLKAVRSIEHTDVIFGGSEKQHKLSRAAVTIRFSRESDSRTSGANPNSLAADAPEVEIRRKVYVNGESSYELQRREARLLDLQLFLAERNVGARNYAVIGQGQIDEVLRISPADRLDFFYEATGVKKYQIKLHKARLKLASSRERISETEALLKELGPRRSYLEKQAEQYVRRKEILDELSKKYTVYYREFFSELNAALAEKRRDFQQLEKELKKAENGAKDIEMEMERASSGFSQSGKDLVLMGEITRLSRERDRVRESIREIERNARDRLEGEGKHDVAFLRRRAEELEEFVEAAQREREGLDASLAVLRTCTGERAREVESIARTIQELKNHPRFSLTVVIERLEEIAALSDHGRIKGELREFIERLRRDAVVSSISEREEAYREEKAALDEMSIEMKVLEEKRGMVSEVKRRYESELEEVRLHLKRGEGGMTDELVAEVKRAVAARKSELLEIEKAIGALEAKRLELTSEMEKERARLVALQKSHREAEEQKNHVNGLLQAVKIDITRIETKREEAMSEMVEKVGESEAARIREGVENYARGGESPREDFRGLRAELRRLEHDAALIGEVSEDVMGEYGEVKERYDFLTAQSEDLNSAIHSLEKISRELEQTIKTQFGKKFSELNRAFGSYVHELFSGGRGELSVVTTATESEEGAVSERGGIEITVHPPGKKIKHTGALSGGERSLAAAALLCAIISSNPPPFVILDEIDAALDEANSKRLADIIQKLSAHTQFIIITHNRTTMEVADVLYGVTMDDEGVSRIVGVTLEGYT